MTLDELVQINKDYFIKMNTAAYKAVVFSYFPPLAIPPFSLVVEMIVKKLVTKAADKLDNGVYFEVTDLRLDSQGKIYVEAKRSGDEEKIKAAFRNVGRLTA